MYSKCQCQYLFNSLHRPIINQYFVLSSTEHVFAYINRSTVSWLKCVSARTEVAACLHFTSYGTVKLKETVCVWVPFVSNHYNNFCWASQSPRVLCLCMRDKSVGAESDGTASLLVFFFFLPRCGLFSIWRSPHVPLIHPTVFSLLHLSIAATGIKEALSGVLPNIW